MPPNFCSITLAAGASSRMPEDMRPKACCKVGTISVVDNALKTYEAAGITRHVIVIGVGADLVMEEVTRRRHDVLFAYQGRPRGTGDAVQCALDLLAAIGPPEHLLISAGDKVIAPEVVRNLLETYIKDDCDLCITAGPTSAYPYSGRVVERNGAVRAIIELPDIRVRQLAARLRTLPEDERPATIQELAALVTKFFARPGRMMKCFPSLADILSAPPEQQLNWPDVLHATKTVPEGFSLWFGSLATEEAAQSPFGNMSVYAARFAPLAQTVRSLRTDNAMGEFYLTDVAGILSSQGRTVRLVPVQNPKQVMAFNDLQELDGIRRIHAEQSLQTIEYPSLEQWGRALAQRVDAQQLRSAVDHLAKRCDPSRQAILVRSPGQINLLGRHIDHQGGVCNLLAIDREIVMVAAPRNDDRINLWNLDSTNYPPRSFTISELTSDVNWENWRRTLDTQFIRRILSMSAGDWVNYVKGAILRLQHRFADRKLRGMDAFVCGNIPVGAGLGSSSALLVAAAEAIIELNGLNVRLSEFMDLCGEGEWFEGAGGSHIGHAAIKHSREKQVVNVSFFPFNVIAHHTFPDDCSLIVCNSGQSARKTEGARELLNERIACYYMAREMIREEFPQFANRIKHLRDVNMENLELTLPALYGLLLRLPNTIDPTVAEAMARRHETIEKCLAGVDPAKRTFRLRDMAMYAIAETERARRAGTLLEKGYLAQLGKMMTASHNGDRVATWDPDQRPYNSAVTDERLQSLIRRSTSIESLEASAAALWQQPGAYNCSTPEIDLMVDAVSACPGVIGAQLSGAGLGGCVMALVREDAAKNVQDVLQQRYYLPRNIEPQMFLCRPARGSHVITTANAGV